MLRVAIVGAGWAGTRQVEAARELDRKLAVTCLVDSDPHHLQAKANEFAIAQTYTDYVDALADPNIDAVSICLPHSLHAACAIAAARAGKHILVEKPMAITVADATAMIGAAEEHDVKLYVAESAVYTAFARTLRYIVQTGEYIGELTFATMTTGFRAQNFGYPGRRAWLAELDAGGTGTWMLHGIHSMAELRYILGEVVCVYAREHKASSYQRRELEGTVTALLTLESGVTVHVTQTSETKLPGNLRGYVLHGDRGSVRASRMGLEVFTDEQEGQVTPIAEFDANFLSLFPNITVKKYASKDALSEYAQELEAFADYVAETAEGPTTGVSERRSLAIVQAGCESIQHGRPVDLSERFGEL